MRLFAGLGIPDSVSETLCSSQNGVRGARWRPRKNFHITLAFFDEVSTTNALDLNAALAQIDCPPLRLRLTEAGFFGKTRPRALWVGVSGQTDADTAALHNLAGQCKNAAHLAGLATQEHPYRPHITLAYCRGTKPGDAADYLHRLGGMPAPAFAPVFGADTFSLYSSHLGNGPSHYEIEAVYTLQKDAVGGAQQTR